jgi:hypothetical protein
MKPSIAALAAALLVSAGCAPPPDRPDVPGPDTASEQAALVPVTKKVMLVVYDPVMSNGQKLHQYMSWYDPYALVPQINSAINTSSSGYVNYQVAQTYERNEWPAMQDGFRYNQSTYLQCYNSPNKDLDCHKTSEFDYLRMFNDLGICAQLQSGAIDEVYIYGAPWFAFDEFAWKIPNDVMPYYTPTNGWLYDLRKKNIPNCGRSVFVMGFSYERGLAEALESYGHRIESALSVTVGRGFWDGCRGNATLGPSDWDHFSCIDKDKTSAGVNVAGCGSAHFPPNGRWDYDDANTTPVTHACPSWDSYPFTTKTLVSQACASWGCGRESFLRWWMAGIPVIDGLNTKGNLNNWWRYIVDYDNAKTAAVIPNLKPTAITWTPSSPAVGTAVTFDSGVTNAGFKDSGTFNIRWFVDGVSVGYGGHTSVPKNSTVMNGNSALTYTFTTGGTHTVSFRVDVDGGVAEYDEGDNIASATVSVGSGSVTVIVDDLSSGFVKYGPSTYWYQASIGYAAHMWWTYVNGTVQSNYARWTPSLPSAGNYTVYAYIPANNATSQQAKYRIYHNATNNYSTLNQLSYSDVWVSLGTHYFSANGTEYVELSDATGEATSTYRRLGFDAVKFVK